MANPSLLSATLVVRMVRTVTENLRVVAGVWVDLLYVVGRRLARNLRLLARPLPRVNSAESRRGSATKVDRVVNGAIGANGWI